MKNLLRSPVLLTLVCVGVAMPASTVVAAGPVVPQARINEALSIEDVALGAGESFRGVVLTDSGQPAANTEVVVSQLGRDVARTKTDEAGQFSFQSLRGGLHLVRAGEGAGLYRFWVDGTAPPNARQSVTMVDQVTVRGQRPFKELITSNAVILTGIVIAAIAIPIAVHDARDDNSSGS